MREDQADALIREAIEAMRRNDPAEASARLAVLRAQATDAAIPWLLVAQVAQAQGEDGEAVQALERHLEREPRSLPAVVMMGAVNARRGDERGAMTFYRLALNIASQPGVTVAPALVPLLRVGEAYLAETERRFAAHLEQGIVDLGLGSGAGGARIRQSLDLLFGRSEIYQQQPSMFYFPGLPQRAFFEREAFDWLPALEAATPAMRDEVMSIIAEDAGFTPYVQTHPGRPAPANPLLDDPSWSAFYLWKGGERTAQAQEHCPATLTALDAVPLPQIAGRSPMAIYSLLRPGTHIRPHNGMLNTRLICHLPLIAPEGCGLRVGSETRGWHEGETLIFDDSIEHEAWNRGEQTRVVLLFEIWRPELTEDERSALTGIFATIDRYQGAAVDTG